MIRALLKLLVAGALLSGLFYVYQSGSTGGDPLREGSQKLSGWQQQAGALWNKLRGKSARVVEELPLPATINPPTHVYKWRDAQGRLHISDSPPDDITDYEMMEAPRIENSMSPDELPVPAGPRPVQASKERENGG